MIAFRNFSFGPNKAAFHRYLTDFRAVEEEGELLKSFCNCTDVMPTQYARLLFLPPGATYRDAVQLLLSTWKGSRNGMYDSTGDSFCDRGDQ